MPRDKQTAPSCAEGWHVESDDVAGEATERGRYQRAPRTVADHPQAVGDPADHRRRNLLRCLYGSRHCVRDACTGAGMEADAG